MGDWEIKLIANEKLKWVVQHNPCKVWRSKFSWRNKAHCPKCRRQIPDYLVDRVMEKQKELSKVMKMVGYE